MTEAGSNAPKAHARPKQIEPAISPAATVSVAKAGPVAVAKTAPVAKSAPVVEAKPATVAKAKRVSKARPVVRAKRVIKAKRVAVAKANQAPAVAAKPAAVARVPEPRIEAVASPAVVQEEKVSDISSAAPLAAALQEGSKVMATKIETGADKVQAVFGDAQARIKTAWDKQSKLGEELVEIAKGNVEAVVASARVAAKHGEEIGQEAADYGKKSFENAIALFRSFASVKSPTELFQLQSDFAKSSFDSAVAETSKVSEKLLKIAGEVTQPISNRYAVAAEKLKSNF